MSISKKLLQAAAGNAGESLYVEDVFSTYLYTGGEAGGQTITNDIDLAGEGGMVWIKGRNYGYWHQIADTERGANEMLSSNSTNAQASRTQHLTSFNSDGFTVGTDNDVNFDVSGVDPDGTYASWTFRKAEKFFDVVTWTGDGVTGREIAHNLGSAPAVIIIKSVSFANNWLYNHNFGASGYDLLYLDLTNAKSSQTYASGAIQAQPTDSSFTLKNSSSVNGDGNTYVAYLFASDAGGFGDDGSESIIKCGSYTGNGSTDGPEIDLGFEPQWLMIKGTGGGDWTIFDNMRGLAVGGNDARIWANQSSAENNGYPYIDLQPTGFKLQGSTGGAANGNGSNYIYIAIRRPMKTPESGTEVYQTDTLGGTLPNPPAYYSGFAADWSFSKRTSASGDWFVGTRLTQGSYLRTNTNVAEVVETGNIVITAFDYSTGVRDQTTVNSGFRGYMFKRATGFFDVVAYTGTGSATTQSHNLGVVPELIIVKVRDNAGGWQVYSSALGATKYLVVNENYAEGTSSNQWNNTAPTDSVFTVGTFDTNESARKYIAYLFATLAGVSKVGSYTGTAADLNVDCGFSAGARFILIKRTDSTGDWYVWDSARGIVSGNDPYLLLNSTAAEVTSTDYIDPLSSGFTVTSSAPAALNASGGTYIFLAIA